jgi:hypothetical protein
MPPLAEMRGDVNQRIEGKAAMLHRNSALMCAV